MMGEISEHVCRRHGSAEWTLVLAMAAWLTGLPGLLAAQDQPSPGTEQPAIAQEPEPQAVSEEITVTSRKREESLQDVPLSVAAPSEEVLRARGVDSIEGVAANVPGFTVQNLGPGQSQVAMRGVSAGQIVRDQPGVKEQVGIYLDESPISLSLFTPDLDLVDMARVEVLRGPQGTLFGSGSLSGTVRYITRQPELGLSESFGEMTASAISGGEIGGSVKVGANVPVGEKAALRVVGYHTRSGGFVDAVQPSLRVQEDVNGGDRTGVRLAFRAQPNERLTITPRLVYQEVDMDGWNREDVYNLLGNPFTTTRPAVDLGEREQFSQLEEPFSDEFLLADLTLDYDLGEMTLTSITSFTDRDVLVVRDTTMLTASFTGGNLGLPESIYTLDSPLYDATQAQVLTQELRLSGGSDTLAWLSGIFYTDMTRDYGQQVVAEGFEAATGMPTQGLLAPRDVLFFSDLSYDLRQIALFGEVTWAATERLDLTGGLRYYDFEEDRTQVFDGAFGNDNNGISLVSNPGSTSADGFAPRLIASYALNDTISLNAQVSKGFRLGGINDPLNRPLCTPQDLETFGGRGTWKDEELWNYEVGSKSTVMGGRGTINAAVYYMDISDLQATVTAGSCSSRVVFNVPKARSQGIELELTAAPNESLDFALSASYSDSELRSTLTSTDTAGTVSVVSGLQKGNRLPTVPKLHVVAATTGQWRVGSNWLGYVTGTYQHVGSRFTQIGDQAVGFGTVNLQALPNTIGGPLTASSFQFAAELPAYDLVNLRLGFLDEKWDAALFINNVTDERALLALEQERGTLARVSFLTNQPRTYGVSARVKF